MEKIKRAVDACSNPPQFRGVKTPITGLLDPEDKSKREDKIMARRTMATRKTSYNPVKTPLVTRALPTKNKAKNPTWPKTT